MQTAQSSSVSVTIECYVAEHGGKRWQWFGVREGRRGCAGAGFVTHQDALDNAEYVLGTQLYMSDGDYRYSVYSDCAPYAYAKTLGLTLYPY